MNKLSLFFLLGLSLVACSSDEPKVAAGCIDPNAPVPAGCYAPALPNTGAERVCGCNGVTYETACFAQAARVTSWTPGACP